MKLIPEAEFVPRGNGTVTYSELDLKITWVAYPTYTSQTFTTISQGEYVFEIRYRGVPASFQETREYAVQLLGRQPFFDA